MKAEYKEGPEVAEKFTEAMQILFRTPKPKAKKKSTSRKSENRDKD